MTNTDLHIVFTREMMVEENPQLFSLDTKTFSPLPEELSHFGNGTVLKKVDGKFVENPLTDDQRDVFSTDKSIRTAMDECIVKSCTGGTNYEVAWFACDFNPFMQAFTKFHFEV
ncbi:hypothetical protein [Acinetobacter sp.]|uniref:hypothetical protein n=1 Tax=Acinetobacter sp. TaxID=472 RepID=UPI0038905B3A